MGNDDEQIVTGTLITSCGECPCNDNLVCCAVKRSMGKRIKDATTIPRWCPLKDNGEGANR